MKTTYKSLKYTLFILFTFLLAGSTSDSHGAAAGFGTVKFRPKESAAAGNKLISIQSLLAQAQADALFEPHLNAALKNYLDENNFLAKQSEIFKKEHGDTIIKTARFLKHLSSLEGTESIKEGWQKFLDSYKCPTINSICSTLSSEPVATEEEKLKQPADRTPLNEIIAYSQILPSSVILKLVKQAVQVLGADITAVSRDVLPPLYAALLEHNIPVAEYLFDHGMNPKNGFFQKMEQENSRALVYALEHDQNTVADFLHSKGVGASSKTAKIAHLLSGTDS